MSRKKPVPGAKTTRRVPTLLIRTTSCSSNHHEDCFRSAFSDHHVFLCSCSCHRSKQMDLSFVA